MSTEIEQLSLEPTDSVASLRVKLSQLRGQRVLLIWPPDSDNLKRKLDLVLLQREADRSAIQLAIVSDDPRLIGYAAELNISCFESAEASQEARWKRSRQKVFLPRAHRQRRQLQADDLAYIAGQLQRRRSRPAWRSLLAQAIALLLLIGVVGALIVAIAPGAVLLVSLRQERVSQTIDIIADRKAETVNIKGALIPAALLQDSVETTVSVPASGIQWLDSESAAASGGNRSVAVVAAEDHARLLEIARIQLQSLAYDQLRANLADSQVIVIESLQIAEENKDWLDYSAAVGARSSEVSLTMRAVVSALAIDESQARQVLLARLKAAAPADMTLLDATIRYQRGAFSLSRAKQQVRFSASADATLLAKLDGDSLRGQLAGASLDEARAILAGHSAILPQPAPRISLHPPGWGRMPVLPLRIHIEAREAA